jgi:hypothetical protein
MDYRAFVKKLPLPAGFTAPVELEFDDLRARPLGQEDLAADLAAVNSSVDVIHETRGGAWPEGELSEYFDLQDLVWHEREFREGLSFAYVVYDDGGRYIGCFYLNPMGRSAELTEASASFDVDVDWWVTAEAYPQGYYDKLYRAVQAWLAQSFPFSQVHYSNAVIPS